MTSKCPTKCDMDCKAQCHEAHQPHWRRSHRVDDCILAATKAEYANDQMLAVFQQNCPHLSLSIMHTDYDTHYPTIRNVKEVFEHEVCDACGMVIRTRCTHRSEWTKDGKSLLCIICGNDGT